MDIQAHELRRGDVLVGPQGGRSAVTKDARPSNQYPAYCYVVTEHGLLYLFCDRMVVAERVLQDADVD